VTDLVPDVLRHRLVLSYEALAEGLSADELIGKLMHKVRAPAKPLHANVQLAAAQS
jgi:MoxR-like ATPase